MLVAKHTVETTALAADVWDLWQDVKNWNTWDHGIEFSSIDGLFSIGTTGSLKPKGGPLVSIKILQVEFLKSFVCESKLFLAKIIVSHDLTEFEGKRLVTHQIEMIGPLAFLFAYLIGRSMKKNLPQEMESMIKQASSFN